MVPFYYVYVYVYYDYYYYASRPFAGRGVRHFVMFHRSTAEIFAHSNFHVQAPNFEWNARFV